MDKIQDLLWRFPFSIGEELSSISPGLWAQAEELRLRAGYPALLICGKEEYSLSGNCLGHVTEEQLNDIINKLLNYSEYAYETEIREGYIPLGGGHRVGFCGQVVREQGNIKTIRNITSINLRIAKDVSDAAAGIWDHVTDGSGRFQTTLISSPPGCGKTTLLRSLIRKLSEEGYQISVCDERNELWGFDLGKGTDVMRGCRKEEGMLMMLRSMGPQILAADEIGTDHEVHILRRGLASGVQLLITIHGGDLEDIVKGPLGTLVSDGSIQRIIFLSDHPRKGTITSIWKASERKREAERKEA